MFCPKCGTQNEDTAKYCKNCGNALIDSQSQQPVATRTQLPGVACHYHGCTEPVIGQCPGYKGRCLRYYCATHSIEPYCSVCADKILRDAAIRAMYEDYLEAAKKVRGAIGCGEAIILALFFVLPCSFWARDAFSSNGWGTNWGAFWTVAAIGTGLVLFSMWSTHKAKMKEVAEIDTEKPGFKEFYLEYERQKKSESMANVLMGLLAAGAAANAIQTYQMRQDIREIVKKMKS